MLSLSEAFGEARVAVKKSLWNRRTFILGYLLCSLSRTLLSCCFFNASRRFVHSSPDLNGMNKLLRELRSLCLPKARLGFIAQGLSTTNQHWVSFTIPTLTSVTGGLLPPFVSSPLPFPSWCSFQHFQVSASRIFMFSFQSSTYSYRSGLRSTSISRVSTLIFDSLRVALGVRIEARLEQPSYA
jgi:hypothetical protein